MDYYNKLEKVMEQIITDSISEYYSFPENFEKVKVDVYETDYGIATHLSFLFKTSFNATDSDFIHDWFKHSGIKQHLQNIIPPVFFKGGLSSSNTVKSYYKSDYYESKKINLK